MREKFTFIDLFAGIGGFHLAMHKLGGKCVFASEIDEEARKTYQHNYESISPELFERDMFNVDIRSIAPEMIPDFDILCAGFPCQPFSQAGYKRGFNDTHASERGNLFFNIVDILQAKRPKAFFLENVRGLVNHDEGNTFKIIRRVLEDELGYSFYFKIVKASEYGLPQLRPRAYMIGFRDDTRLGNFDFPPHLPLKYNMSDVWEGECSREIGFTLRVGGRGSKITDRRNWDSYLVDGEVKRLMPEQGKKLQGFSDSFEFPVSKVAAMKQLGNSVAVDAIYHCGKSLVEYMNSLNECNFMNNKSNKGEWCELYSLVSLINSRYLGLADKNMSIKDGAGFNVTKVKTLNSPNEYVIGDGDTLKIKSIDGGSEETVSISSIINDEVVSILAEKIRSGNGRSFEIAEFDIIKSKLGLYATKGGSSKQKADVILDVNDQNGEYPEEGFGIKSYLGNKPTLLNASGGNTNFVFKIEGVSDLDFEAINAINTGHKVKRRLAAIEEAGGVLVFDRVEAKTMEYNLKMIDSSLCEVVAEMLRRFYTKRHSSIMDCVTCVHVTGVLNDKINYGSLEHLGKMVKKLLVGVMLGFFTGDEWDGNRKANGTIIVKEDGSQVGYHIIDESTMEDYLFTHIKFDTPSTTRHRFASIIKEADGYYFKLNLQLRF